MKKTAVLVAIALALAIGILYFLKTGSATVSQEKKVQLASFLKKDFADTTTQDYRSHGIQIDVAATNVKIDSITKKETAQDTVYFIEGRISYIIQGNKKWTDREGNRILLDTGREITHWFSCGILEDRYLGTLFKDDRNRFILYAERPVK